jgi:drug/metabolite transporter (DMT)-like permease
MARLGPFIALLFTTLIWGVAPVFIRTLSLGLGPTDALVIRYTLVALICVGILMVTGGWRIAKADWPRLVMISIVGLFGYSAASVFGFATVPAGIGGLIYATQPLFIAMAAVLLLGEKLTPFVIGGLLLALAGTVLLFWDDLFVGTAGEPLLPGVLLLLVASCVWAFYTVPGKVLFQRYGSLSITAMSMCIATLPILAFASSATIDTLVAMTPGQWFDLLFLAFFSTFIAMIGWNYAAARLPASTTGAFLYLIPVVAVCAGAFMLGETVALSTILGGLLIIGGVAIAQFGPRQRRVRHVDNAVRPGS